MQIDTSGMDRLTDVVEWIRSAAWWLLPILIVLLALKYFGVIQSGNETDQSFGPDSDGGDTEGDGGGDGDGGE